MFAAEDITAYFGPDDVATLAGTSVRAIFENGYTQGNVGMTGMAASQPMLTLASTAVPTNPVGAAVLVGVVAYIVTAHEPDGTGISRLLLEATA